MSDIYVLREYYIKYLKEIRNLSDSSVKHYLNAINTVSRHLSGKGIISSTLYEITDLEKLGEIKSVLFSDVEFLALNSKGHQMYSSGFNNYYRFANGEEFANVGKKIEVLDFAVDVPDQKTIIQVTWQRNPIIKRQSIEQASYMCEFDGSHKTFIAQGTSHPYMEGHHAIPMREQGHFSNSLDIYANVVCLCPICHRLLHYGEKKDKLPVLDKIYFERSERLHNSGIDLSRDEFLSLVQ